MSKLIKKVSITVVSIATVLSLSGAAGLVPTVNAAALTSTQVSAIITLLQSFGADATTIANVQASLTGSPAVATTGTSSISVPDSLLSSSDLTVGSKGAAVMDLQKFLNANGYTVAASGAGSLGNESTYFGNATKTALAKWQAAMGITPASGYFGKLTRAKLSAMAAATTSGSGTTTTTGTTVTVPSGSGLSVSVASTNPATGSLISSNDSNGTGAARVPVLAVSFTAGNAAGVTVSEVKFHKVGVLSDSSIAGAYLVQNGKVLYQYNSLNQGVLDFSGMSLSVPAGQTVTLTLAIDVSGGLSAGNTTSFSLNSATDVSAVDANSKVVTPTGTFPLNGNIFTVTNVSNPSLATVAITDTSVGNQVTAGTQNNLVGAWNFNVNNSKVYLNGINFHIIGSANKGDIRNVKLMVNGTQVGATLATVAQDGTAYFDLSSNPGVLNTGSNNVQIFADVMGSPSYNFQFEILNAYDVLAVDSQYNVPVPTNSDAGTLVNIQQGQTTMTQDVSTPTGNIAKGQSSITIAKFDVYAAGEAVKILYLPFSLTFTGATTSAKVSDLVQNISIVDDAGNQVGTTINIPSGNLTNAGVYADSFGTSGSPINYQIPANTTRVLSLKADIEPNASFSTVTGALTVPLVKNMQGMISSVLGFTSGANGSALTLADSSLTVTQNNALGNQSVSAGVSSLKVGSYAFTASSAEGVNINNVSIQMGGATASNSKESFQNLKAVVNGVPFGTIYGTLSVGGIYTFSGTPFVVPAGQTVNVDVYADTLSNALSSDGDVNPVTYLSGFSGTGQISYTSVTLTGSPVAGQSLTFAGQSTISISADSSMPASTQIVMGSTGNNLGLFDLQETSNVENVKVTDLVVNGIVTSVGTSAPLAGINNLSLYNGSTLLGQAGSAVFVSSSTSNGVASSTYKYSFHFGTPILVPQNGLTQLTLKGDVPSYTSNGATDASQITFTVPTDSIVALGQTSNKSSNITASGVVSSNSMTVARTALTVTASLIAQTSKMPFSQLGTITLTANSAGSAELSSLNLTFGGSGLLAAYASTTGNAFLDTIKLMNSNNVDVITLGATSTVASTTSSGSIKWTFSTSTPIIVSAGTSLTLTLWGTTNVIPAETNVSESLSASIQNAGDLKYFDGTDATTVSTSTNAVSLPSNAVPITVSALSWGQGN
jgi:hypothetical protein